jgi:diguanylate cyclase (GGDEF)-like protein
MAHVTADNVHLLSSATEPPRVLVVDDDRTMRTMLRRVLEREGYQVVEAIDGRSALHTNRDEVPDIILMDAAMPGMDGFEACSTLREAHDTDPPPVLMITALDDNYSMERAFAAGASDYITKPVNWTILRQRVRRMVGERRAEKRIKYLAHHDSLTGLANRRLFLERLAAAIEDARARSLHLALLFLDLDGFKLVNDTLGHDAGDMLLETAARRLAGCVRAEDMVARLGGDEFTIVLRDVNSEGQARGAAARALDALAHPVHLMEREIFIGASIGIALYPSDGADSVALLKNADTAMYRAKDQGRNTFEFYTPDMGTQMLVRMSLESSIRRALDREEFTIHYQPLVDLASGRLISFEALVRWQHPDLGLVSPADFVPLAEETGLIKPLGRWVLREACVQSRRWQDVAPHPVRVGVNLSGKQFADQELVRHIAGTLEENDLSPSLLELEITENTVMHNTDTTIAMLSELKRLGIQLSVDDFGTGYSSLSYLKRLPLDVLKIDRSFVGHVPDDADDSAIVTAIVAMAQSLRLGVVAEGVETAEQVECLRGRGCDTIQGFYLGRPMPAKEALSLVARGGSLIPDPAPAKAANGD